MKQRCHLYPSVIRRVGRKVCRVGRVGCGSTSGIRESFTLLLCVCGNGDRVGYNWLCWLKTPYLATTCTHSCHIPSYSLTYSAKPAISNWQKMLQSPLTSVGWECKIKSRCPRKTHRSSGWRVCKVSWGRITLVIRSYWRVIGASRRGITSGGSPRVLLLSDFQISGWSWVRGWEFSRWGLWRISFRVVESNMVGRRCSLGDLCLWVSLRLFSFSATWWLLQWDKEGNRDFNCEPWSLVFNPIYI